MAKRKTRDSITMADMEARTSGPQQKKKWSLHDLKGIQAKTDNQMNMSTEYFNGKNICALGSAGSGKTYLSMVLASHSLLDPKQPQKRIIIVRSVVPSRDIGFLPGTLEEKVEVYELPYKDILADLFGRHSTYDDMKKAGLIEFHTTSFLRGLTWDNAVIIVDEVQNAVWQEINTVMTRVGNNSRVILIGDSNQDDLAIKGKEKSCIDRLSKICHYLPSFSTIRFTREDIVRSEFVKDWIIASEDMK
jgi:phosphate starvation-inducible protein PhoH and related proteins